MPARPVEARGHAPAVLHIQLPPALKNSVVEAAGHAGMSVTGWVANVLRLAVRGELGIPEPPPPSRPLPTPAESLLAYLTGERVIGPCGRSWPCDAVSGTEVVAGVEWCRCGIRLV